MQRQAEVLRSCDAQAALHGTWNLPASTQITKGEPDRWLTCDQKDDLLQSALFSFVQDVLYKKQKHTNSKAKESLSKYGRGSFGTWGLKVQLGFIRHQNQKSELFYCSWSSQCLFLAFSVEEEKTRNSHCDCTWSHSASSQPIRLVYHIPQVIERKMRERSAKPGCDWLSLGSTVYPWSNQLGPIKNSFQYKQGGEGWRKGILQTGCTWAQNGCLSSCYCFSSLSPWITSSSWLIPVIPTFLWWENWMSQICLTNLPCVPLCPLSTVMTFLETAWGFFVLFEMFFSGLFCPRTSYISFCLGMFCCLLLWLRGQGWNEAGWLVLQSMEHINPTLLLRSLESKGDKCPHEKNYECDL